MSTTKTFRVYSASAGAGKTFSLVREYLSLCLASDVQTEFTRILAITFTLKAAGEMKRRVLESLDGFRRDLVPKAQQGMFNAVKEELGIDDATLQRRANAVLKSMLHDYTGLSISTIDKFTYRLVRTFSHDLGLSSNFDVELDEREMHRQSIDLLLDDTGRHEQLTALLHRYVDRKMDEGKSWKPEREMLAMANHLGNENSSEILSQLESWTLDDFVAVRGKLEKRYRTLKSDLTSLGKEGQALIAGIPENYFSYGAVPAYFKKIVSGEVSNAPLGKRLLGFLEKGSFTAAKVTADVSAAIDPIMGSLMDVLERCHRFEREQMVEAMMLEKVLANYDGMAVLHEISEKLRQYKEENNLESLRTFNKLIYESLVNLPAAYIYERIGEKYRHYFVDEFQDTSSLQWLNLTPLVHNAVSSGGTTMIVGDAKQSIYRWRGGEAEQFIGLIDAAQNPEEKGGDVAYALTHVNLEHNWRSATEIVKFNNGLFASIAEFLSDPQHGELYKAATQNPQGYEGGLVSIEFLEKGKTKELFEEGCLRQILVRVQESIADGFDPGDIAILVRNNKHGEAVARLLTQNGISVVSVDSLKLKNSSAVLAMVAYIRIILFPKDVEARMELVEMLHQSGVWDAQPEAVHLGLMAASDVKGDSWEKWLTWRGISQRTHTVDAAGLYEWGEEAARALGLIENRKPDPFVQFFLDELYEFSRNKSQNIVDFLLWWDEKGQEKSISVPASRQAVQVMTIHKSKGLEFPVVIFPYANFSGKQTNEQRWVELPAESFEGLPVANMGMNRELAALTADVYPSYAAAYERFDRETVFDNINLMYVVLTRAVDRLYVMAEQVAAVDPNKGTIQHYLLHYLSSLDITPDGETPVILGAASPAVKSSGEDSKMEAKTLPEFVSNPWRSRVRLSRDTDGMEDELSKRPRMWGNTIHELLAGIRRADDAENVLKGAVRSGLIPREYEAELSGVLQEVVHHPLLRESFAAEVVYNEREWIGGGEVHRPDRVTFANGQWTVIDYKTGEASSSHQKQIREYADLLEGTVKCYLVYLNAEVRIEEVAPPSDGEQLTLL